MFLSVLELIAIIAESNFSVEESLICFQFNVGIRAFFNPQLNKTHNDTFDYTKRTVFIYWLTFIHQVTTN